MMFSMVPTNSNFSCACPSFGQQFSTPLVNILVVHKPYLLYLAIQDLSISALSFSLYPIFLRSCMNLFKCFCLRLQVSSLLRFNRRLISSWQCVTNVLFFLPMNIQIYLWPQNLKIICTIEYICLEIFKYLNIFECLQSKQKKLCPNIFVA